MIINRPNLSTLGVSFSAAFMGGLSAAPADWDKVAMEIASSSAKNEYGWLGEIPEIRKWLGERQVNNLRTYDYSLVNEDYENTIAVRRNDVEDDNLGLYAKRFEMMGRRVTSFPDTLIFPLLKAGFTGLCYDGQYFFDTDHPVLDAAGVAQSVSNTGGGSGTPWALLATGEPLKPLIYQKRRAFEMVAMDRPDDEQVFARKEFRYGVDGRATAGFGMWQCAYGSMQTLDAASYGTAFANIETRTGDYGVKLALKPSLLVVPPTLRAAAWALLKAPTYVSGGATVPNPWFGSAELLVTNHFA